MSDTIETQPRAHAAPNPIHQHTDSHTSRTSSARPADAHTAPSNTNATATTPAASAPVDENHRSWNRELNDADRMWKFKSALRLLTIIAAFIGVGTIGWIVSTTSRENSWAFDYYSYFALWPALITFSVSIVWCALCILVLVIRTKPVHPGVRVAIDLILWLAFIATALFALFALQEIQSWGEYGSVGWSSYSSSRSGEYGLAANNTWVWTYPSSDGTITTTYTRDCDTNSTSSHSSYYDTPSFSSCAEQDAYVNRLWHDKPHRVAVETTGVACQFICLLLHFALFVWACVDTHRHNRSKVSKDAEKIAQNIVQTMISNGTIIQAPSQAHWRQTWGQSGYYPLQQQGYPMTNMYPQQQPQQSGSPHLHASQPAQPMSQPKPQPVAGPSTEKAAQRYA